MGHHSVDPEKDIAVYLLLGSDMGNRPDNLRKALDLIDEKTGRILKSSPVYETQPWGFRDETMFLNQVVLINTSAGPFTLMESLLDIEASMGRNRTVPSGHAGEIVTYCPRVIDIDLLFYGDRIIRSKNLVVPHPRLHERKFTLIPLAVLDPGFVHPILKKSIRTLLEECSDQCLVIPFA